MEPGVRYADVARRNDITPPQLYQWRMALREGRLVDPSADSVGFVDVRQRLVGLTLSAAITPRARMTPLYVVLERLWTSFPRGSHD